MKNKREETVFSTPKEGLDSLLMGPQIIYISEGILKGYFKANPFHLQNVKTFGKGRASFFSLIVPTNSPLKPILQKASNQLMESGTMDYLIKVWLGNDISWKKKISPESHFFLFADETRAQCWLAIIGICKQSKLRSLWSS